MEEERQKILDSQLNFIVDQTEIYTGCLTQTLQSAENVESTVEEAVVKKVQGKLVIYLKIL